MPPHTNTQVTIAGPVVYLGRRRPPVPTCRDDVLSAMGRLIERTGEEAFTVATVFMEMADHGTRYKESAVYLGIGATGQAEVRLNEAVRAAVYVDDRIVDLDRAVELMAEGDHTIGGPDEPFAFFDCGWLPVVRLPASSPVGNAT